MLEKIKEIIADQLSVPAISVSDDKTLEDLGADNVDVIYIAMWLEDEFDIEITTDEALVMCDMTIADLAEAIEKKVNA